MYSTLTIGPFALPTAPLFALSAWLIALEIAGRFGKKIDLDLNDIWNTGLIAISFGLIAARIWNVIRFWSVYSTEPLLIFSLRPSGFELLPGLVAALIASYAYLLYKALDPLNILAASSIGLTTALAILAISDFLTGAVVGTASGQPWAANYFGESVHPAALYRALGFLVVVVLLFIFSKRIIGTKKRTAQSIILYTILGCTLSRLIADGFVQNAQSIAGFRISQIAALLAACAAALLLSTLRHEPPPSPVDPNTDSYSVSG